MSGGADRRWWILAVLVASEFVVELDTTIVNVALPDMARSLRAGTDELQWVVDAYTLVFAALTLFLGTVGDRAGRRGALLTGMGLFFVGSTAAALATDAGWLIATRAVMGLGAAFILPATLSILVNVFPQEERGRAFAVWSSVVGLSFALGPTLGGWLVERSGWSAIFWINLPILAAASLAALVVVPPSRDPHGRPSDPLGAALSVGGLGTLVYALIEAPRRGWDDALTVGLLAAALLSLAALVAWEAHTKWPMLDLQLFRERAFRGAVLTLALTFLALGGALFILTQYLQFVLGYSPLGAGLRLAPVAIVFATVTPLSVGASRRFGVRSTVTFGMALTAASLGLMATVSDDSGYGLVLASLVLAGAGVGCALTPATEVVLSALPPARAGGGSALNTTALTVGGALGVAILGSVLSSGYSSALDSLGPAVPDFARESIAGALALAASPFADGGLAAAARSGFVDGAGNASLVGAAIVAAGAATALWLLPRSRVLNDTKPLTV